VGLRGEVDRVPQIIGAVARSEQHSDSTPPDLWKSADRVQKVKQRAVAIEDVVVSEWIEVAILLKASGEPIERLTFLDNRDIMNSAFASV
jgi:hypothetical protein